MELVGVVPTFARQSERILGDLTNQLAPPISEEMMTYARKVFRGTTIHEWHHMCGDNCVCTNKPLTGQIETTEETPLISLTCSKCRYQGITLTTGSAIPVVGIPEAIYKKVWQ